MPGGLQHLHLWWLLHLPWSWNTKNDKNSEKMGPRSRSFQTKIGGSPINGLIINGVILGFFCSPPINGVITTGFTRFMSPLIKHRKRSMKNYHKTSGWRWCFTNPPNKNSTDSKPWWKNDDEKCHILFKPIGGSCWLFLCGVLSLANLYSPWWTASWERNSPRENEPFNKGNWLGFQSFCRSHGSPNFIKAPLNPGPRQKKYGSHRKKYNTMS